MASATEPATPPVETGRYNSYKPIRVDNWGNFLAQRIETLYDKQEHCDLTLRFPEVDLKAHSIVLHACTPFFTNLLKGKTGGHKILKMPPQISCTAMNSILKFVYTGRLDSPYNIEVLYETAKLLKLQILIRLLEVQIHSRDAVSGEDWARAVNSDLLSPHRLPRTVGTRRNMGRAIGGQFASRRPLRPADPPADMRPSRFELPESEAFELPPHELATEPLLAARRRPSVPSAPSGPLTVQAPAGPASAPADAAPQRQDREALFETLRQTPVKRPPPDENGDSEDVKRPRSEMLLPGRTGGDSAEDVTTLKEYSEEQRRRVALLGEGNEQDDPDDPTMEDDWRQEDADPEPALTPAPPVPTPAPFPATPTTPITPRPILKQEPGTGPASSTPGSGKKRVQFSESPQITLTVPDLGNTAELVGQLIKKHPELLHGAQNVKVRLVTQPSPDGGPGASELMVVKAHTPSSEDQDEVLLTCTLCARAGHKVGFILADDMERHFREEHADVSSIDLNTVACTACLHAGDPVEFANLDDYFAHLREVHGARGVGENNRCALCGHTAGRKLDLIYHQHIAHGLRPPRFISFPKCHYCKHVAQSDRELTQHIQRSHKIVREYRCKECNVQFEAINQLESHMRTKACRPRSESGRGRRCEWKCEVCGMSFSRSYNLKSHMRIVHKLLTAPTRPPQQPVKQEVEDPQPGETAEFETSAADVSGQEARSDEAEEAEEADLDPSSEAESLSTVASSVAASLSLAVQEGEYVLPDSIVPVQDENGVISYIALRPAADPDPSLGPDEAVVEVTQYTVPVVVGGGGPAVALQLQPEQLQSPLTDHETVQSSTTVTVTSGTSGRTLSPSPPADTTAEQEPDSYTEQPQAATEDTTATLGEDLQNQTQSDDPHTGPAEHHQLEESPGDPAEGGSGPEGPLVIGDLEDPPPVQRQELVPDPSDDWSEVMPPSVKHQRLDVSSGGETAPESVLARLDA